MMPTILPQVFRPWEMLDLSINVFMSLLALAVAVPAAVATVFYKDLLFCAKENKSYIKNYKPLAPNQSGNRKRKLGTWQAETFEYPEVQPYEGWNIKTTDPMPYRAFKHTYFVTMGIRNMDWQNWIELDNEWLKYHNDKVNRVQEKGTDVYGTPDDVWDAAIEMLMEFRNFLPSRYPTLFERTDKGMRNKVTGENFEFVDIPKSEFKQDPMLMASMMVQDDLAILTENAAGEYILRGGAIMLAGFWRLKDKFNLPLSAIHTTGDVPKYKEKLQKGMEKFFIRLTPDKPVVRNNYFIQTDADLPWSRSIGDEENENVGWYTAPAATDINNIYYRSERQSVRRLPKTGAIAFTIRTYFLPVTRMCEESYVPRRLLNGIQSWDDDVRRYRGFEKFKDVLLPYLEKRAEEQEAAGLTVETEKGNFPF